VLEQTVSFRSKTRLTMQENNKNKENWSCKCKLYDVESYWQGFKSWWTFL